MQTIEFQSGAVFHVSTERESKGAGIPTVMTREELLELSVTLLNELTDNPVDPIFVIELPFVMNYHN